MIRSGTAEWHGGLKDGHGSLSTESQTLDNIQYSFKSRFESDTGTNPEELIAAAHAGCYSMALSALLEKNGYQPESVKTTAKVTLEASSGGFSIPTIELEMTAEVPNIEESDFNQLADEAKDNCPVSKLMNANISLKSHLEN